MAEKDNTSPGGLQTYRSPFLGETPTDFLSLYQPGETSSTSQAQSLKCSCSGIVQSTAISESYCSLQTVSGVAAFTLKVTEQMGFSKFTSKVEMFDGCYNEKICDYTGIHRTLELQNMRALYFFDTMKVCWMGIDFSVAYKNYTTANSEVSDTLVQEV